MELEGLDELHVTDEPTEDITSTETDNQEENNEGTTGADVAGDKNQDGGEEGKDESQEEGLNIDLTGGETKKEETKDETDEEGDEGKTDEPDGKKKEESDLSGIEQYLSQFNIEGGMIDFQDGSRTHFNDLESAKQVEVLTKLHEASTKDIEERYGLDEQEINLINFMRQQEGTIEEVIDGLANQRAQMYLAKQSVGNANIEEMDDDAIYTAFLLKSNPEADAEQLEKDLTTAKQMSNYGKVVASLKQDMIKDQENKLAEQQHQSKQEMMAEIEDQRKEVVAAVSKMNNIDGLTINDGIKNDVLDLILDVDEDGDSLFMTEVFGDPEKLFRAAFWYKNGLDILATREDYWKKEKSAAYKRGQADASKGKKTFTSNDVKDKNKTAPHYSEPDETVSWDDIQNI